MLYHIRPIYVYMHIHIYIYIYISCIYPALWLLSSIVKRAPPTLEILLKGILLPLKTRKEQGLEIKKASPRQESPGDDGTQSSALMTSSLELGRGRIPPLM